MCEFTYHQVRDVMTSKVIKVGRHVTLSQVEKIFEEHDFNGLPVVDGENRLIGMITKLDLMAFAFIKGMKNPHAETFMDQSALQIMVNKPHVFAPEDPLIKVLQKMIETGYKSFPVVESDRVIGIVAREDVLQALREANPGHLSCRQISVSMEGLFELSHFQERQK